MKQEEYRQSVVRKWKLFWVGLGLNVGGRGEAFIMGECLARDRR